MDPIAYFKLQSKNLFRDYKTKYVSEVYEDGGHLYDYKPHYFDVNGIVVDFDIDEENFTLMKAQHVIAYLAGFRKWTDLIKASGVELELAKLLFDNQHKISIDDWDIYMEIAEEDNQITFDAEERLEIFKEVFVNVEGHHNDSGDYRLMQQSDKQSKSQIIQRETKNIPSIQITSLPLSKLDRAEFIEVANSVFETVILRMEPQNPDVTRKLWNAEDYVDNMLTDDMLPISQDYALSLIDAFLVHHVLGLAAEADKQAQASVPIA